MLSKVAERVYWTARYLERVENTARLIGVYDKLLFDLPRDVHVGWYNLIVINGAEQAFNERFSVQSERNVIKFLLDDTSHFSSVVNSLKLVRENVRTTRDVVPADAWELVNELSLFVAENIQQGINRSQRFEFLDGLIKGCQQIHGLIYGTMPHDDAWYFMRMGRNLERTDMTTRILDAGTAAALHTDEADVGLNARQIIWGNVLRSVGAEQAYRRATRSAVNGQDVIRYLVESPAYPRAIQHCLNALIDSASHLPRSKAVQDRFSAASKKILKNIDYSVLGEPIRDYLNDAQLELASLHEVIAANWFAG